MRYMRAMLIAIAMLCAGAALTSAEQPSQFMFVTEEEYEAMSAWMSAFAVAECEEIRSARDMSYDDIVRFAVKLCAAEGRTTVRSGELVVPDEAVEEAVRRYMGRELAGKRSVHGGAERIQRMHRGWQVEGVSFNNERSARVLKIYRDEQRLLFAGEFSGGERPTREFYAYIVRNRTDDPSRWAIDSLVSVPKPEPTSADAEGDSAR